MKVNIKRNHYPQNKSIYERARIKAYYVLMYMFCGINWGVWCVFKVPAGERKEPAILIITACLAFLLSLLLESREYHYEKKTIGIYTAISIVLSFFAAIFIHKWWVIPLYITEGILCFGMITKFKFLPHRKK